MRALVPAWLSAEAPGADVVLSSRSRALRNLRGRVFPHRLSGPEAVAVLGEVGRATSLTRVSTPTAAEMGELVSARLVPSEYPWTEPGRAVFLDHARERSLLVNEEDHIRLQTVSAGDHLPRARALLTADLAELQGSLAFAEDPDGGYLAASVYNRGPGRRDSAMLHLVGLVATGRISAVLRALSARRVVVRGLFGESSRAVGGFAQISSISGDEPEFDGALRYLVVEEREARRTAHADHVRRGLAAARRIVEEAGELSLADAVRVLGWLRWGRIEESGNLPPDRLPDALLAQLDPADLRPDAGKRRAELLRELL